MQLIFIKLNNGKAMFSYERNICSNLYSGNRNEVIQSLYLGKIGIKDGSSIFSRVTLPVISTFIVPFVVGCKTMSSLNTRLNKSVNNFFIKGFLYIPCLAISVIRTLLSYVFSVLYLTAILLAKSTPPYSDGSIEEWEDLSEEVRPEMSHNGNQAEASPPPRGATPADVINFMQNLDLSADYATIIGEQHIDGAVFCTMSKEDWTGRGVSEDDATLILAGRVEI